MRQSSVKNASSLLPVSAKKNSSLSLLLCASAAFVLLQASDSSAAGIDLKNVDAGTITVVKPDATHTNITASDKSIGNFNSFSIASDHFADVILPNSNSVTLFRDVGGNTSEIAGSLHSNGRIMLVNPNGVFFGENSRVDVAGMVASTADTTNADFLAGKTNLSIAGKAGAGIVNKGHITAADGGLVALVAPSVRNDGVIQANMGTVALASAQTASVDFYGDNLYSFALDKETTEAASGAKAAVENNGIVSVGGGKVLLTAKVAKGVVDNVINNTGIIEAVSSHMEGGVVVLDGGDGNVNVAGTISATGTTGGKVNVTGENITLAAANINASGKNAGGTVKIGGDYQGKGTTPHAKTVKVDTNSKIDVSATDAGNGGTAIVWSDELTDFNGSIFGTGGVNGGNGGLAEVSSKGELGYNGFADLHAENGDAGTLLLDPHSLFIGGFADHFIGSDHFVNFAPLVATLNGGTNVIADAHNNVSVLADMIWAGSGSFTINAGAHAIIEADIRASFNGTDTQGAVTINAGTSLQMGNADISTNKGDVIVNTNKVNMSFSTIKSSAGDVIINNTGRFGTDTFNVLEGKSVTLHQSTAGFIQNAIDAVGNTGSGGALLLLGDGMWNEDVIVDQGKFTIMGNGIGNTIVNAESPTSTVITVGTGNNDVTISGLSVTGGEIGIDVESNSGFKLDNSSVSGASEAGVHLNNTNSAMITNSDFSDNFFGISGENTNFTKVTGNSFHNGFAGVFFNGDTNLTIKDNEFFYLFGGIGLQDVVGAPITNNIFESVYTGIVAEGGGSLVINNNILTDVDYGIITLDSIGVTIANNTLSGNYGYDYEEDYYYEEEENYLGSYGIHVIGGLHTAIVGNDVDSFEMGIGVEDSDRTNIIGNTVTNTGDAAIFLTGSDHTFIFDNIVDTATTGIRTISNTNLTIDSNEVLNNLYGVTVEDTDGVQLRNNIFTDNGTGAAFYDSDNATLTGDIFTGNVLGINLNNSQNTHIHEASITSPLNGVGILIENGSGNARVRGLNITGGGIGVLLDGEGSSMQFESNTSYFSSMDRYFHLQNDAMFGDTLDASQQFFEGVRASDFTLAQRDAAEFITTDVEDGIPTIGNVFYKDFEFSFTGLDGLFEIQEFPFAAGRFSYAGRTIDNDPGVTPPEFNIPSLNLSLLSPAAGGAGGANPAGLTPSQLGGLEPAAGGNIQALAALEPAAGGDPNCGNNFLSSGFNNDFDNASCSVVQQ